MRKGFTTGSCAAAAAKAAAFMLFSGQIKNTISIMTPAGIEYCPKVQEPVIEGNTASCGIIKDGGDDPDVTTGILICARVTLVGTREEGDCAASSEGALISIKGGSGVGLITRPGLEMPVGEAAINSTPRAMIIKEVAEVCQLFDYKGSLTVEIYVPEGKAVAERTFNPHMGIVDGISILGTTGIVEPMSKKALLDTIRLDLAQKYAEGQTVAIMVPGNYGATFLQNNYDISSEKIVHFSNYVGEALDMAVEVGFKKLLIVGHTGKLVKVAGGIMNTHSKEADCRMELMTAACIEACRKTGASLEITLLHELLDQVTTTGCLEVLSKAGLLEVVSKRLLEKILFYLKKRLPEDVAVECILYENSYGLLAKTKDSEEWLK